MISYMCVSTPLRVSFLHVNSAMGANLICWEMLTLNETSDGVFVNLHPVKYNSDNFRRYFKCFVICVSGSHAGFSLHMEARDQLCGVGSLLPSLRGSQGLNSGHQALVANSFYHWIILPAIFNHLK